MVEKAPAAARRLMRAWAERVVTGLTLEDKLAAPPQGPTLPEPASSRPTEIIAPGRAPHLAIVRQHVAVPPPVGMRDPAQRARILHALANHELQAIELFAWAWLAFPHAPPAFRTGLIAIAREEQAHCRGYLERLASLGHALGDFPLNGYFWSKLDQCRTPLGFVCAMGLTFENANLDFGAELAVAARAAGDLATCAVIEQVHRDEIGHVAFAWTWLGKFAPGEDPWQVFARTLQHPLSPGKARGKHFDATARAQAGLSDAFIDALAAVAPTKPSGQPR